MLGGTAQSLLERGFPVGVAARCWSEARQGDPRLRLQEEHARRPRRYGTVVGVFENEPRNINLLHERFPRRSRSTSTQALPERAAGPADQQPRLHEFQLAVNAKTIVAVGGGSFRTYPGNALDTWLLAPHGRSAPKVAFLPTASGDQERDRGVHALVPRARRDPDGRAPVRARRHRPDPLLLDQDLILVSAGTPRTSRRVEAPRRRPILRESLRARHRPRGLERGRPVLVRGGVTTRSTSPSCRADGLLGSCPAASARTSTARRTAAPLPRLGRRRHAARGWAADDGVGLLFETARSSRRCRSSTAARPIASSRTPRACARRSSARAGSLRPAAARDPAHPGQRLLRRHRVRARQGAGLARAPARRAGQGRGDRDRGDASQLDAYLSACQVGITLASLALGGSGARVRRLIRRGSRRSAVGPGASHAIAVGAALF
jgi:hypothetical protein